jgi:hypothetical protein
MWRISVPTTSIDYFLVVIIIIAKHENQALQLNNNFKNAILKY